MSNALRPFLIASLSAALLAGCGDEPARPVATSTATTQAATVQVGDVTIRASAVQTSTLASAVAGQYGIERGDGRVLLLVGVRRGTDAQEASLPAKLEVTVTDLRGQRQTMAMRELRSGDLLDYIGTVEVSLPDTLRFDLSVVPEGGTASSMQFTREFYPR